MYFLVKFCTRLISDIFHAFFYPFCRCARAFSFDEGLLILMSDKTKAILGVFCDLGTRFSTFDAKPEGVLAVCCRITPGLHLRCFEQMVQSKTVAATAHHP
jgi:hypothetical protein